MEILFQIVLGLIFLLLALLCFTLPGRLILKKNLQDLNDIEKFTLYSVFGLVVFTLSAYVLAALHLRSLMWVFPALGLGTFIKYKKEILNFELKIIHKFFFLLTFIVGIAGMVAVNALSGFPYRDGIYFWSSHGHDGIWHLALMESMKNPIFPFQNPELCGAKLQNYHFFADLL